jgi:hypothetical protein
MSGTDKFAISMGDAIFRAFRIDKLADYASEKIIQRIFSIRGFVNPADPVNPSTAQAQANRLSRTAADTPEIKRDQAESLRAEWKNFKAIGRADAVSSAIKDAQWALVVGQSLATPVPWCAAFIASAACVARVHPVTCCSTMQ